MQHTWNFMLVQYNRRRKEQDSSCSIFKGEGELLFGIDLYFSHHGFIFSKMKKPQMQWGPCPSPTLVQRSVEKTKLPQQPQLGRIKQVDLCLEKLSVCSGQRECIRFLFLHSKLPKTKPLKTMPIYYLTVSLIGSESGHSFVLCSGSHKAEIKVAAAAVFSGSWAPFPRLWQNPIVWVCRTEVPVSPSQILATA